MDNDSNKSSGRLERLMGYLASDETNLSLLSDAAEAALHEHKPEMARELLQRYAGLSPLGERETNIAGLAALRLGAFEDAAAHFGALVAAHPDDPSLRFNQAWTLAMLKQFEPALALLDAATARALPQGAMLQVQLMHELGQFDEATLIAREHIALFPEHPGLLAAVSVLAVDVEDMDLARACASKAGDHPDALTTLGILALGEARDDDAAVMFGRALAANASSPRAWIGKGLVELTRGAPGEAALHIERGAVMFDSHIGSWIAAGWAHFLNNNMEAARAAFERALALDHNFAESHGSLAVIALVEGRTADAKRLTETAMRLDRSSFAAALARALLFEAEGKPQLARAIVERAMHAPIDASGVTIAQAIAKRALFAQ
jgi:tetratricopeptide (TPR) repeat protein